MKEITPKKNLALQMLKAFLTGGVICVIGQVILNYCQSLGMEKDIAGSWCSLLLILLSVLLTGFSIYQVIAAWVPITGFANSVASPAIEYKAEGQVYGIGVKIFSIAGPVILYGVFTSGILGFFYWIGKLLGWV
ncbi:MAG: SpoVA protein [Firmicutes bacterium CAG_194_44_15]|nr:MAG: SpoVA protein [Firmicutes bacterium CAG_194_44_15]